MINISDKFTAKTMDGIVADSHQIQYEQGKTTQRGDTVADKITELEGKIGTVQTDLDGYVKYQQQTKTEGEKQTARDNIGAASMETVQALKDKDTALDGEISSIKTSTESIEKAVANSLSYLKTNTYTKAESDGKYALKTDAYTKAESNKIYNVKKDVYDKQYMDEKFKVISSGLNDFDERSNSFATKADVPFRFVKMSQSEYDNLAQKDENTIYIILYELKIYYK